MDEALRYKLRCFSVTIDDPAEIFCDNKLFITNSSVPASVLNKMHNAICYHRVRKVQALGVLRMAWIGEEHNITDLFTKTTLATNKKHDFITNIYNNNVTVINSKGD